jgi:hypothetical protein
MFGYILSYQVALKLLRVDFSHETGTIFYVPNISAGIATKLFP